MTSDLQKKLKHYRISESEYQRILKILNREPRPIEWPLFSALWSEHCSYKSSKIHLKKFAKTLNETVVNASGENAGIIDLGLGERIAFKMESHNHPSFIEPYQGAATGVGGILRDIFTMGARPIAIADYLCFGETTAARMPFLMDGVVRGISGYGNCVGVPTITGQTNFHSSYNQNILVNAMAVGLFLKEDPIALSGAKGPGNLVVYVGAKTGKDGVHGAAMASESFDENSEAKKPNVQIGDPYFEKLLIESCLQVIRDNLVVSIQDMGAAGLTSSSFEMASKGQVGMKIDLDLVPMRDSSMTPEEILLSESQERMLLICEPNKFSQIEKHFQRWGLDAAVIGSVIAERKVKLFWHGEQLTDIDPDLLVENAPLYERPFKTWDFPNKKSKLETSTSAAQLEKFILSQISGAQGASREPIYRQYDQRVGAMTARGAESDISLQRLPSGRSLAMAVGCRPQLMNIDAKLGGYDAVFYPALQMAAKGVRALAITDCLNFGNPEKIEIMSEFVAAVDAIAESSIALKAPVISGNVSFYNETMGVNITSTPATGVVGIRENVENIPQDRFCKSGLTVFTVTIQGPKLSAENLNFSGEFLVSKMTDFVNGIYKTCQSLQIQCSQVVGLGGLGLALTKMTLDGVGFESTWPEASMQTWSEEGLYQVILATDQPAELEKLFKHNFSSEISIQQIGKTGGSSLKLSSDLQIPVGKIKKQSDQGLTTFFQGVRS